MERVFFALSVCLLSAITVLAEVGADVSELLMRDMKTHDFDRMNIDVNCMIDCPSFSRVGGCVVTRGSKAAPPATNLLVVLRMGQTMSKGYRAVTGFSIP